MISVDDRISYPDLLILMIPFAVKKILEQVKEPYANPIEAKYASP